MKWLWEKHLQQQQKCRSIRDGWGGRAAETVEAPTTLFAALMMLSSRSVNPYIHARPSIFFCSCSVYILHTRDTPIPSLLLSSKNEFNIYDVLV